LKPFEDKGQFRQLSAPQTTAPSFSPSKSGYGVEIRDIKDIFKRKNNIFISAGQWTQTRDNGLIDQQVQPSVLGQNIDPLDFVPFSDENQKKTAVQVLEDDKIISGRTIDFESETSKDGRITVFNIRPRGYVTNEEIPHQTRGIKSYNETILGYSTGRAFNPFRDGGDAALGISRVGFYGKRSEVTLTFADDMIENGLGFVIDVRDYNEEYQTGAFGFPLYSSTYGTDSIAYAGLLK
jgi:hypothetical protein